MRTCWQVCECEDQSHQNMCRYLTGRVTQVQQEMETTDVKTRCMVLMKHLMIHPKHTKWMETGWRLVNIKGTIKDEKQIQK